MTPFSDLTARKIRNALEETPGVSERQIIGGVAFLVQGNMCCGVFDEKLVVRVGPDAYDEALREPHARPMDFTGRPLPGFVYIAREGYASETALRQWIDRSVGFVRSLPQR
jgi:TfoX/Sxy family transcriptional regulator of competence genes